MNQPKKRKKTPSKWVLVDFDYCSSGLWKKSGSMMEPEDLPVSRKLKERLSAWIRIYDLHSTACVDLTYDINDENDPIFESEKFKHLAQLCSQDAREGVTIAILIKRQIPDWTVMIRNEESKDNKKGENTRFLNLPVIDGYQSEILSHFDMPLLFCEPL